ncbi:MAG TPA: transcriptional activator NhaR [Planctomycetota bacterium]|nr:transcriptional activator NhaR [Planctomycetota bacterium]
MDWLNYHHLLYFWVVAREGSVTRASEQLHLSQPTVSAQIRELENALGQKLFTRVGRSLILTDAGRMVYRYADEIFPLGRELMDAVKGIPSGRAAARLVAGVADVVPKLIAYELLKPALELPEKIRVVCREDKPDRLLAELSVHSLDVVISDAPVAPTVKVRAFSHLLGECSVSLFGVKPLATKYRRNFPHSLDRAPILMPGENTMLRRAMEHFFSTAQVQPEIVGEFDDNALLSVFGAASVGVFAAPTVIQEQVCRQFRVELIGELKGVRERFYALSVERKVKHPAVAAVVESARTTLFTAGTREAVSEAK